MNIQEIHTIFLSCSNISIDTRKIANNALFVAIKGENFDANTFAKEALEKGASYVIIDNKDYYIDQRTILVNNSLECLQELAKFHRTYLNIPIVALTGSNGKTTTKELTNVVLSKKYNTKATIGNLNNHIGVPLTLLSFNKETEIGIVEMGANHQKEIEFLCEIAQPNYGYITNFGKAHLEGFGGEEGVIKGKSEMYHYLKENNQMAFVNSDDAIQFEKTKEINRYTFSNYNANANANANVFIEDITANPNVKLKFDNVVIQSNLIGLYNATNISAAITIGNYFKVATNDIKTAIESYFPENNRSQIIFKNTNEIILDAYNANPSSMKLALENFIQLDKPNKIIIVGDMFELGEYSLKEHKIIVETMVNAKDIDCHFIGKDFFANKISQSNFNFYKTFDEFSKFFSKKSLQNKTILIKGSRGMSLEKTLNFI